MPYCWETLPERWFDNVVEVGSVSGDSRTSHPGVGNKSSEFARWRQCGAVSYEQNETLWSDPWGWSVPGMRGTQMFSETDNSGDTHMYFLHLCDDMLI